MKSTNGIEKNKTNDVGLPFHFRYGNKFMSNDQTRNAFFKTRIPWNIYETRNCCSDAISAIFFIYFILLLLRRFYFFFSSFVLAHSCKSHMIKARNDIHIILISNGGKLSNRTKQSNNKKKNCVANAMGDGTYHTQQSIDSWVFREYQKLNENCSSIQCTSSHF